MEKTNLTPEQSLLLISKTIEETKDRFKEYGGVFVFWGALTIFVFGSQLVLSLLELYRFTILPVYLFPAGGVFTGLWAWRDHQKNNKPKTFIAGVLQNIGWIIGMNLMVMGFLFSNQLGEAMGPVFIILFALMVLVSGLAIKFKPLILGGAITNVIGLASFMIDTNYHGFSLMLGALVGMIIPGLLLNRARRRENV